MVLPCLRPGIVDNVPCSPGRGPKRLHPEDGIGGWWCSGVTFPWKNADTVTRPGRPTRKTAAKVYQEDGLLYIWLLPTWCTRHPAYMVWFDTFSRTTYIFCKLQDSKNGTKQRKLHLKTKIFAEKFARCKISSYLCIVRKKMIG